ncbi:DUF4194 domain-containing protein [Lacrimispora amygdalina]|uniref:DUF4194 domain-containing protein n=1 Tax=Lacrimispora amygdalina TaxID=253257 RepID=UPI000BE27382|nr:DUF4194 domain-containing protein [Lacrimispora amygdalina]
MKIEKNKNLAEIKDAINALLKRSFLMRDRNRDIEYYLTVQDNLVEINEYLDFMGYEAVIDRDLSVIALAYKGNEGIVPPKYKMTTNETKIYMALIKIFDRKVYEELIGTDVVKTNVRELKIELTNYDLNLIPNNKITTFQKALDSLERYNLIELIDKEIKDEHSEFQILPSIKLAMNREAFMQYFRTHEKTYFGTEEDKLEDETIPEKEEV